MKWEKTYEIENNEKLLDFRFEAYGLPMWVFLRRLITNETYLKLYHMQNFVLNSEDVFSKKTMLKYYLKSALNTPFCYKKKDILFLFSATVDALNSDSKYENRVFSDFFMAAEEKSITMQTAFYYTYKMPSIDKNAGCEDIISLLADRDKTELSERELKNIESFLSFLKDNLCVVLDESVYVRAKNILLHYGSRIKPAVKYYKRLYKSISPKAVVLENALYIYGYIPIKTYVAKKMGIKVVEIQHGIISKIHPAYNFGSFVRKNKAFISFMPDYFLLYGEYWRQGTNAPSKCIAIGNPNFYKKQGIVKDAPKKKVLVLYNIPLKNENRCLSDYAIGLARQLPDYEITYRFFPFIKEENILKKLNSEKSLKNLKIDTNPDIYTSLNEHEVVVSEVSTVIYEAACVGRKVFLLNTELSQTAIDPNMFVLFDTLEELVEKIREDAGIILSNDAREAIFNSNYKENYKKFLTDIDVY